jgi:hypothetical protein
MREGDPVSCGDFTSYGLEGVNGVGVLQLGMAGMGGH